ncbi:MAG: hypothetical protein O2931_09345 [Planctomycetota bacterium]|nr:hypothetical protein [Planctomycetota bacterium]MDA1178987.1 hypothetical protein [Planctomycetota bacterium]
MLTPDQVLANYFLDTRCKLIEIAAMLDRFDRAVSAGHSQTNGKQTAVEPPQVAKIYQALKLLSQPNPSNANRSEQILLMFSDLS